MDRKISNRIFMLLIAIYMLVAVISVYMPQDTFGTSMPATALPAAKWVMALAYVGIAVFLYGGLGYVGLVLARKLGLPDLWDASVSNWQRFVIPCLVGVGVGVVFILGDRYFAPRNGIGPFPHPAFPGSLLASISAGIGEELIFRLFFTMFWTWLVSRLLLGGRWQTPIYWIFAFLAAIAFGVGHVPAVMVLQGWTSMAQVPPMLLGELIVLNGVLGLAAAGYFKKYGFLAAVGIHFWADVVWHVLWGLL